MNYFAQGIEQGGAQGAAAWRDRQRLKQDAALFKARDTLERDQMQQRLTADAQQLQQQQAHNRLMEEKMGIDASRYADEQAGKAADPREQLARMQAQMQLDAAKLGAPKVPTARVKRTMPGGVEATYEAPLTDLEKTYGAPGIPAPVAPKPPTARVSQKFGDGDKSSVQFEMPVDEARKLAGSSAYKSPYAADIAALGGKIAEQSAEIDGGDTRTGFLGIATSRQGIVDQAQRQRRRLQAMELKDQLEKGVITQDEADRRAELLMGAGAK